MGLKSSGGTIQPHVRLSIACRVLCGGTYHDQMMLWQVGRSTVYRVFHDTMKAIRNAIPMPGLPLDDVQQLQILVDGFSNSRTSPNPLYGCVEAVDGIAISIMKPPDNFVPRNYYCRKGMHAVPVQAVVDSRYRFLYISGRCSGSTHNAVAFDVSDLGRRLHKGDMSSNFWLAGDAAYSCTNALITPWPKSYLSGENGVYADASNFYQSSHRIHVEQAFGILVMRW